MLQSETCALPMLCVRTCIPLEGNVKDDSTQSICGFSCRKKGMPSTRSLVIPPSIQQSAVKQAEFVSMPLSPVPNENSMVASKLLYSLSPFAVATITFGPSRVGNENFATKDSLTNFRLAPESNKAETAENVVT